MSVFYFNHFLCFFFLIVIDGFLGHLYRFLVHHRQSPDGLILSNL